jgi:RimJ/RimL family protein N-acetyltransferase
MQSQHISTLTKVQDIQTARLDLVAITPEAIRCESRASANFRADLECILQAEVPEAWPVEHWDPHVLEFLSNLYSENPSVIGWTRYVTLRDETTNRRILIGTFGSMHPGDNSRQIEVGYSILRAFQSRGYATEAMSAMLSWIRSFFPVRCFVAQTFPHLKPSIRVLEKSGFEYVGAGFEEGTILYRLDCEMHDTNRAI